MLAGLENSPRSPEQWSLWAWDHRDSHDRIRSAILKQYGVSLSDYQIEPINADAMQDFLQRNSDLHDDMNGTLGLQSSDLEDVDPKNDREFQAWIRLHYLEHWYAEQKLSI